ncbi:hypothetical protein MRX96_034630 [Rhipicephalus microplus]
MGCAVEANADRERPRLVATTPELRPCLWACAHSISLGLLAGHIGRNSRTKGHTPRAVLLQKTCTLIEERYSDHLHLYTDGSVNKDGSAAAASIIPALRHERTCRLPILVSSTTAELVALNLAVDQIAEIWPLSTVVFFDSQMALLNLAKRENELSIAQRLSRASLRCW